MSAHVYSIHPAIPFPTVVRSIITGTLVSIAYRPIIKAGVHSTGDASSEVATKDLCFGQLVNSRIACQIDTMCRSWSTKRIYLLFTSREAMKFM